MATFIVSFKARRTNLLGQDLGWTPVSNEAVRAPNANQAKQIIINRYPIMLATERLTNPFIISVKESSTLIRGTGR